MPQASQFTFELPEGRIALGDGCAYRWAIETFRVLPSIVDVAGDQRPAFLGGDGPVRDMGRRIKARWTMEGSPLLLEMR